MSQKANINIDLRTYRVAPLWRLSAIVWLAALFIGIGLGSAKAEKIPNGVAIFAALDKVTARISRLEVALGGPQPNADKEHCQANNGWKHLESRFSTSSKDRSATKFWPIRLIC